MLSPRTHDLRPGRVYPAETMLRRETGQILPGLIMLMLAILALGMLTFRIGRAAVLRSGAQTAADAAALAGARSIRDQLAAQVATTGTSDLARVSEVVVRAAAADYAKRNGGAAHRGCKMEGADVRAWVDTDDAKVDEPEETKRGVASARARVELVFAPGFAGGGPVGAGGGGGSYKPISDKEWKELEKELKFPPDCNDLYKLGRFLQAHGAVPPYENSRLGDPPSPPGERSTTSWHYQCGNSGAIDLNYGGNEKAIIDSQIGWFHKLGFNTLWQVENHYDHIHINPPGGEGVGGAVGGAAGPLQHTLLEVKLVDWDAPSPTGIGAGFVGGPGGIPFGPPNPQVAHAMCQVLDRINVSQQGAHRGLGDGDRRVRREGARLGRPRLPGPVPAAAVAGLGHDGAGPRPVLRDRRVRAQGEEDRAPLLRPGRARAGGADLRLPGALRRSARGRRRRSTTSSAADARAGLPPAPVPSRSRAAASATSPSARRRPTAAAARARRWRCRPPRRRSRWRSPRALARRWQGRRDRRRRHRQPRRRRAAPDGRQPRAAARRAALERLGAAAGDGPRRGLDADLRPQLRDRDARDGARGDRPLRGRGAATGAASTRARR